MQKLVSALTFSLVSVAAGLPLARPADAASATVVYDLPDLASVHDDILAYKGLYYGALTGSGQGGGQGSGQLITLKPKAKTPWSLADDYMFPAGSCGGTSGCTPTSPVGKLATNGKGTFYGVTYSGYCAGTVFSWVPGNSPVSIYNFLQVQSCGQSANTADGGYPDAGLILAPDGSLYGTTGLGGAASSRCGNEGCGTIFHLTPPASGQTLWTETVLYSFGAAGGGAYPTHLILDGKGNLFGIAVQDASDSIYAGNGSVFELSPPAAGGSAWTLTTLHQFAGGADGANPRGSLLQLANGKIYGTTMNGGAAGFGGVVFQLVPPKTAGSAWKSSVIYTFGTSGANDGFAPFSGVISGKNGVLFGTTTTGGGGSDAGNGMVYELTPPVSGSTWTETELFSPQSTTQGVDFYGGLTPIGGGKYLTTTYKGGVTGGGEVIELTLP